MSVVLISSKAQPFLRLSFNMSRINIKLVLNRERMSGGWHLCASERPQLEAYQKTVCDISVKAALKHNPRECRNVSGSMHCISFPFSFLTYPLVSTISLPPSLCVAYCETDGEGKDDRQTEGGREWEAENDKVGKWETISRGWETQRQRGSRCVKHKRPCGVCV